MNRLIALSLLFLFVLGAHAQRAVATLDRSTVAVGEGVGFSIACENFQPSKIPRLSFIPGLRIAGAGSGRSFQLGGGQQTSTLTYNFLITPNKTGTYTLPALSISSREGVFKTQALKLRVVAAERVEDDAIALLLAPFLLLLREAVAVVAAADDEAGVAATATLRDGRTAAVRFKGSCCSISSSSSTFSSSSSSSSFCMAAACSCSCSS